MLVLALMLSSARAEALDLDSLERFAESRGFDILAFIRKLVSGDILPNLAQLERFPNVVRQHVLNSLSGLLLNLALPVLACVALRLMIGEGGTGTMVNLLCALCCGTVLAQAWLSVQAEVSAMIDDVVQATERMTPVLASAAALSGGSVWSSAAIPLSNLCASVIQRVLKDWGLGLCSAAAVIALCGAVAGKYALNRLFDLIKSIIHWMLGAAVFVYGALVSAQGVVGAAKDGAAMRTAKIAIESLVPIIGSGVSDAAGSLAVSAGLARQAVGVTGVALIVRLCVGPMLKTGGVMLALKLVAAAMEPLAEGAASELIGHFGDILEALLAIGICCAAMAAMIPISCAVLTGGLLQ